MNPKFALLLTLNDDSPFDTPGAALGRRAIANT
jgi:hypothetical protein